MTNFTFTRNQVLIGIGVIIAIIILTKAIVFVPSGHVGVKILFGKVQEGALGEGVHIINPLLKIYEMSIRTKQVTEEASVPSKEGLMVDVDMSVLYRLDPKHAPEVYRSIGPSFENVVLVPQLRSVVRGVTAGYEAKALYTTEREALSNMMFEQLKPMTESRGLILEKVLLRSVKLPAIVANAIEEKLKAEQEAQRMKFILEKEEQETQRKRIEANGISDYNKLVSSGLTEQILQLRGIEATKELAKGDNSKVIIIGAGKGGLPVILGDGDK